MVDRIKTYDIGGSSLQVYMGIGLLGVVLLLTQRLSAQEEIDVHSSASIVTEQMMTVTDRHLYVSGEIVWFKAHCMDRISGMLSNYSKVANVELVSAHGIAVLRVKIELNQGLGTGNLELPRDLPSGLYTIRSYTQAMRNFGEDGFDENHVVVLNPDFPIQKSNNDESELNDRSSGIASEGMDIIVKVSQNVVNQRSRVDVDITTLDATGEPISASIAISASLGLETDIFKPEDLNSSSNQDQRSFELPQSLTLKYHPEFEGIHINGEVVDPTNDQGIENALVFLSFPGRVPHVYAQRTNSAGYFNFSLPKMYGLKPIVVQAQIDSAQRFRIKMEDGFEPITPSDPQAFSLDEKWWPLADAMLENAQIRRAYEAFAETPQYVKDDPFSLIPFYGAPYSHYKLDDYTRFPLPEFFYEVVRKVRVTGKFGNERLKMINDWEPLSGQAPPLLLVDGVPVFDQTTFLKINNKLIESTDIVVKPFWLNPVIFDGIISMNSIDHDARSFTLPETAVRESFLGLQPRRLFQSPDYSLAADETLPDFRNTLYWNPVIKSDENGKVSIHFYTSDAVGHYDIKVVGVTDRGIGHSKASIEVVQGLK